MTGRLRSGSASAPTRLAVVGLVAVLGLTACESGGGDPPGEVTPSWSGSASPTPAASGDAKPAAFTGWSDPALVGKPYGSKVQGLLTFRGNPTRTYYGTGPMPRKTPARKWQFPRSGGLCGKSTDEKGTRVWCGTGWTGQPAVFERDGRTWVVFGAYDHKIHFLDAESGERILPDFPTGDIIKGSVTIDPDGFPLVYSGSRDNFYRVIAIDRGRPTELWKLSARAVSPTLWNDDFDGAGLILDDYLFLGGENSQFHIVKLNRKYAADGKVTVKPKLVFNAPGWDAQLLRDVDDRMVSIENSVAVVGNVVYFANSGGLVQGWDISGLKQGRKPKRVFRFWTGDDTDASIAVDETGALYVGSEYERGTARSKQVGQMMKLDPKRRDNPSVWHVDDHARKPAGIWGSPALHKDIAIFDTQGGEVLGVDRADGTVRWRFELPGPTWQSPVVVDDVLVIGDCNGVLHAYDVADTTAAPKPLWKIKLGGCIESTPAVWKGRIYVGTRAGGFHAVAAR
ncbi:PQQ-binding-like beta-propeller repeat protein [Plantactinospora endophytica]|uniref:PQQ-binding-like beta-propeller repeat protein n=1 Tax=Plantactinospora endophytica TaxID=673535 RepID=UPI0019427FC3|nr:PQQ-binding-like beta-propeller repeat protein [Plantactinospora endophytica]